MTENDRNHDEIARRLRDSGLVEAPERLRPDVMRHVRAEPRPRRARRPILRPLVPYAVAACLLLGIVFALSHAHGGGSSASGGGGGVSAGLGPGQGGGTASVPKAVHQGSAGLGALDSVGAHGYALKVPRKDLTTLAPASPEAQQPVFGVTTGQRLLARGVVVDVPRPLYAAVLRQLRFAEVHARGRATVTVVLRPTPLQR